MKIGILTYHRSYNYGAFIQCYALVQRLQKDFPALQIEVIDYTTASSRRGYDLKLKKARQQDRVELAELYRLFDESQELYLPLSRHKIISDDCQAFFAEIAGEYDIVIVGSDAVWNWTDKPFPNAYFLGEDIGAVKMSYAASAHGQYYHHMPERQKAFVNQAIGAFGYIGTRESTAEDMLRYCRLENPIHRNCDPAVLLDLGLLPVDMNDLKLKLAARGADFSRPLIGLMAGGRCGKQIREYFGGRVQVIALYEPNPHADIFVSALNPLEWAVVFSFFDVTVTQFFHGAMLSLKNLTPVIAVETKTAYHAQYVSKLKYALTAMELEMFYAVFDRGSLDIFNRAVYKFGLKSGREFWYALCNQVEDLINNPRKRRIARALEKQEKLYASFKKYLQDATGC